MKLSTLSTRPACRALPAALAAAFARVLPVVAAALLIAPLVAPRAACGADTAYAAMRLVGKERGQAILQNLVLVQARNGAPNPLSWLLVFNDPRARGGVREIEVSGGRIISERTPLKSQASDAAPAINLKRLSLDSDSAFRVAENEARAANSGFYSADYRLAGNAGGSPVWTLQLLDESRQPIDSITIAASTGEVLAKSFSTRSRESRYQRSWVERGGLRGALIRTGHSIGKGVRYIGASTEEFLTGKRTIDETDRRERERR